MTQVRVSFVDAFGTIVTTATGSIADHLGATDRAYSLLMQLRAQGYQAPVHRVLTTEESA